MGKGTQIPLSLRGGRRMQETRNRNKAVVMILAVVMSLSYLPLAVTAGSAAHIWLDCDPGQRAHGGGWQAGGFICPVEYVPDGVGNFTLIVENRGKDPLLDLRIAMAIHGPDAPPPETTSDDFVSITIESSTHYLGDFGSTEYNPFHEAFGGRHHVYVGTDAIWDVYHHAPGTVPAKSIVYLTVSVLFGPDPSDDFEIHFDAFDTITEAKTPNGHDVTMVSAASVPQDKEPPIPCIVGGEERTVNEGDEVTFDGTCSNDPDGQIVSWEWDFDQDVDSDGDLDPSNDVDAVGPVVTFTWWDDYEVDVKLTVTDNDGLFASAFQHVTVLNVPPELEFEGAFIEFELSIRVAGEKWHNVELLVVKNYDPINETWDEQIGAMEVERWPGPPDQNPSTGASIPIAIDVSGQDKYTAIITYDPFEDQGDAILGDQPINGQLWGANPIWLTATFPDGTTCKQHHTFNVQQSIKRDSDHWNHVEPWIIDLNVGAAAGVPIKFVATATDPGSDDLTFDWDFGDGNWTSNTYLYDPLRGADPAFPPGSPYEPLGAPWDPWYTNITGAMPPVIVTDTTFHTYGASGTYTVTLTVTDDDGGTDTFSFDLEVGDGFICK
jgi:PKD repeat protein